MDFNAIIEKALIDYLPEKDCLEKNLILSMEYSLKAGGKRIRPRLVLEFCSLCGGDINDALPLACALEMIHTYSLIHDDLPCMDNDDYRRGKPSNHKVYGEDIALLAGDAMQSLAFETATSHITPENAFRVAKAVNNLATYCGATGMVGGQVIDIENEGKSSQIEILKEMDRKKTGAIIKSACEMGCILAGASQAEIEKAQQFGESIGLAFQIQDDILDVTADQEKLGKPVGSDKENEKSTYVSLLGLDKCRELVDEFTNKAIESLEFFSGDSTQLKALALSLAKRDH
ncbi:MAG: farnesyl diphosphate synthase [Acutalibacteraceae bacterium]|nr:farnesyl diphosphate synthase [Acutalibacteraceae bacterium]